MSSELKVMSKEFRVKKIIHNSKLYTLNSKAFTIVEILVVLAVISIIGVIITEIFFNTLKGSNKSNLISKIKQNGQTALDTMDKTIRNADNVVCPVVIDGNMSASSDILVIEKDGKYTRFSLQQPTGKNSYLAIDNPAAFDNSVCDPSSVDINITDKNNIKITKDSSIFTRNKVSGFNDVVSIEFKVSPGIGISESLSSQIDPIPFVTSIQLR